MSCCFTSTTAFSSVSLFISFFSSNYTSSTTISLMCGFVISSFLGELDASDRLDRCFYSRINGWLGSPFLVVSSSSFFLLLLLGVVSYLEFVTSSEASFSIGFSSVGISALEFSIFKNWLSELRFSLVVIWLPNSFCAINLRIINLPDYK
jgi:hypothetical protein